MFLHILTATRVALGLSSHSSLFSVSVRPFPNNDNVCSQFNCKSMSKMVLRLFRIFCFFILNASVVAFSDDCRQSLSMTRVLLRYHEAPHHHSSSSSNSNSDRTEGYRREGGIIGSHLWAARKSNLNDSSTTTNSKRNHNSNIKRLSKATSPTITDQGRGGDYNDDAFGFVFLGGAIIARDPIFAGCFVVLSAIGAIATRNGTLSPSNKKVPAVVAASTLIVAILLQKLGIAAAVAPTAIATEIPPDARIVEIGLCSVSIAYALFSGSDFDSE